MSKFIVEMLDEINKDPKQIEKYKDNAALTLLFKFAFHPNGKFLLPEGDPPYKEDAAPLGMSPANLTMEVKKFINFCRADLKPMKREQLFIQLLESVHPSEAKLILAVKDQNIPKLYKKITHKLVYEAGMVPNAPLEKKTAKKSSAT